SVLSLVVAPTTTASIKLDSMANVSMTSLVGSIAYQYTITYTLYRDGTPLAQVLISSANDNILGLAGLTFEEIPNMTWVDSTAAGSHTYEIRIAVSGAGFTTASVTTRALNAMVF
ncbi:MAG: hypothetical protein ACOYU3_03695, partial [Bacillota bacterium]